MKSLVSRIFAWLINAIKAGNQAAPYPFDDVEGEAMWNAGKEEYEREKAVNKQVAEWQRWTSAPRYWRGALVAS